MSLFVGIILEVCLSLYAGMTAKKIGSWERMFVSGFCAGLAFMLIFKACVGN